MKERMKFENDMAAIWEQTAARVAEIEDGDYVEDGEMVPTKVGGLREKLDAAKREIERLEAAGEGSWNERSKEVAALLEDLVAEVQEMEAHNH